MDPAIILLIASGLALLSKAGLAMPVAVLVGVPIVLAVLVFIVHRSKNPVEAPTR